MNIIIILISRLSSLQRLLFLTFELYKRFVELNSTTFIFVKYTGDIVSEKGVFCAGTLIFPLCKTDYTPNNPELFFHFDL